MADFCTVQNVEELLRVDITDLEAIRSCQRAITEATAAIRNYCGQYLELVEDDEYTFDVRPARWNLMLPELPVTEVSQVVEDGETLEADDWELGLYGQLWRVGRRWTAGVQVVTVTYSHGYASIPDDVVAVCMRAAVRAYQAGLKSLESAGVPVIASKSLGDYAVSFASEGTNEGLLGASGTRMLLLSEKDVLDKYRQVLP